MAVLLIMRYNKRMQSDQNVRYALILTADARRYAHFMNLKITVLLLVMAITLGACSSAKETQVLPFEDPEMYTMLKAELKSQSVWFEDLGDNKIRVNAEDVELVFTIAEEAIVGILPRGRSQSLAVNLQTKVIEKLKSMGISFKLKCFDNSEWLIWESQHTRQVEAIIEEVMSNMSPQNLGGLAQCAHNKQMQTDPAKAGPLI